MCIRDRDIPLLGPGAVDRVLPAVVGDRGAPLAHHLAEGLGVDVFEHIVPQEIPAAAQGAGKGLVGPDDVPRRGPVSYTHLDVYKRQAEIIVAKNRHGETKPIPVHWQGEYMRYTSREVIRHE